MAEVPELGPVVTGMLIGVVIGALGHLLVSGRPGAVAWHTPLIGVVGGFLGTVLASVVGVPDTEPLHGGRMGLQTCCSVFGVATAVLIRRRPDR